MYPHVECIRVGLQYSSMHAGMSCCASRPVRWFRPSAGSLSGVVKRDCRYRVVVWVAPTRHRSGDPVALRASPERPGRVLHIPVVVEHEPLRGMPAARGPPDGIDGSVRGRPMRHGTGRPPSRGHASMTVAGHGHPSAVGVWVMSPTHRMWRCATEDTRRTRSARGSPGSTALPRLHVPVVPLPGDPLDRMTSGTRFPTDHDPGPARLPVGAPVSVERLTGGEDVGDGPLQRPASESVASIHGDAGTHGIPTARSFKIPQAFLTLTGANPSRCPVRYLYPAHGPAAGGPGILSPSPAPQPVRRVSRSRGPCRSRAGRCRGGPRLPSARTHEPNARVWNP